MVVYAMLCHIPFVDGAGMWWTRMRGTESSSPQEIAEAKPWFRLGVNLGSSIKSSVILKISMFAILIHIAIDWGVSYFQSDQVFGSKSENRKHP